MTTAESRTGEVLDGRYRLGEELGRGGMSTVYRGRDLRLQRDVAIKIFRAGFADAVDPRRNVRETQLLAAVSHPAVVRVLDAGTEPGGPSFLVMELVEGCDLGLVLRRSGALGAADALRIGADVAGALAAMHAIGVVHRDVKPANVLVLGDDRAGEVAAKLTDFGIAQLVDSTRITANDSILGTAAYLSPEQVHGSRVGPASDVYALGLVLLECLTGARAFPGPATESALARLVRPPQLPMGASPALADLLSRMTALDPDSRPAAEHVATALRRGPAADVTGPPLVTPTVPPALAGATTATMPVDGGAVWAEEPDPDGSDAEHTPRDRERRFPTLLAVGASAVAASGAGVVIALAAGFGAAGPAPRAEAAQVPAPVASSGVVAGSDTDGTAPATRDDVGAGVEGSTAAAPVTARPSTPAPSPTPTRSTGPGASPSPATPRPTGSTVPDPATASAGGAGAGNGAPVSGDPDPTAPSDGDGGDDSVGSDPASTGGAPSAGNDGEDSGAGDATGGTDGAVSRGVGSG